MSTELDKARENYLRYVYARDEGHLDFIKKALECDNYYNNIQWDQATIDKLNEKGLPHLTLNKVRATIDSMMGEYFQNRADIMFVAASDGDEATAATLSKIYRHIHAKEDMTDKEATVFQDGLITGRGYFDVRIDFNHQMLGEVVVSTLNPKNVLPDPDAEHADPRTWNDVIVTKFLSEEDIINLYGGGQARRQELRSISNATFDQFSNDVYEQMHRDRFKDATRVDAAQIEGIDDRIHRRYRVIERQYKRVRNREHFLDLATGDVSVIPDNWDDDKISMTLQTMPQLTVINRPVKEIHWCVSLDRFVLFEGEGVYKNFTVVPFFPNFRRGRTPGVVEVLQSPQDMYNKISSQELHVVNTTANSGWIFKRGSLVGMSKADLENRGADTGITIEYDGDQPPQKIQPNQVPTGLDRLSFKANQDIFEISGHGKAMRGLDREDVSGKAIREKRDAGGTGMAMIFSALSQTRIHMARCILDLVQAYYTEPRTMRITKSLFKEAEQIDVNMPQPDGTISNDLTMGKYDVRIVPIPLRDTHDQTQFDEAMRLKVEAGVHIPDYRLIEYSHLDDKEEIAEEIKQLTGGPLTEEAQQRISELEAKKAELDLEAVIAETELKRQNARLAAMRAEKIADEIANGNMTIAQYEEMMQKAAIKDAELSRKDRELDIRERTAEQHFGLQVRDQARKEVETVEKITKDERNDTGADNGEE